MAEWQPRSSSNDGHVPESVSKTGTDALRFDCLWWGEGSPSSRMSEPTSDGERREDPHRRRPLPQAVTDAERPGPGAVLIVFYFVSDLVRSEPLATPRFLAGSLLGQGALEITSVHIALFTVVHFVAFITLGVLASALTEAIASPGTLLVGTVYGLFERSAAAVLPGARRYWSRASLRRRQVRSKFFGNRKRRRRDHGLSALRVG